MHSDTGARRWEELLAVTCGKVDGITKAQRGTMENRWTDEEKGETVDRADGGEG